ncbi:hypothetical protein IEQ34_010235 [Dendrobium chrysotoxum]|uniref:SLH domain-containing protein n=1 Tax=Dendrobium chrysotoxum TaxID=161865 RepID=A0AAV7GLC6_DENCH|nr:hypothetical protein IEQ34_010235 [Dendrobium chrysotoxum]
MSSYLPFSPPPFLSCKVRTRAPTVLSPWNDYHACRFWRKRSFVCALEGKLEASWIQLDGSSDEDGCGGWSVRGFDASNRTGLSRVILAGIGTSAVTILLAALAYRSCLRKGCFCAFFGFRLKFGAPLGIFHNPLVPSAISEGAANITESVTPIIDVDPVESIEYKSGLLKHENKVPENKRIVVPVPADPTQLEALHVLKMLKIIDYDASADDLCTRREYARWLVKANCMLERKTKHRIVPTNLIAGSVSPAFDDVNVNDSDFWCIQALGEAGIVSSRLSSSNPSSLSDIEKSNEEERFYFFPNNFISRLDLVNWRAVLEYSISSNLKEKISRTKPPLSDLSARNLEPQLVMDLLSGDGSIVTRTFGNIRRLQPDKPVTKAQAAVALTGGRMADAIRDELSRLEAEELSRLAEMEEIRLELIHSGVIKKHWEEKLSEEKILTLQVERDLESALFDLEIEKTAEDDRLDDYMKAKTALECERQLLSSLKKEVDEMNQKLDNERVSFMAEKQNLESQLKDLQEGKDAVFEARSALEAEKEAVQMLRTWVEEEAWHIRSRASVLEQAVQRWKVTDTALFFKDVPVSE